MAFTVRDFHDLVELLEEQPTWRAELRRLILTDEVLGLPQALRELAQSVRELAESQRRYEERSDTRFTRIETDIHEIKGDVSQLKGDVSQLKGDVSQLKGDVARLDDRLGELDGRTLEQQVRERLTAYLSRVALRLRPIADADFAELLEAAVDEGRISEEEMEEAKLIDAVARGRRRSDGETIYLALEISVAVNSRDVERALRRATIITAATGVFTLPVVVGKTIRSEVRQEAESQGASWVVLPQG